MRILLAAFFLSLMATSAIADQHLTTPPELRREHRLPAADGGLRPLCVIKGNIDRNGERVFFVPKAANYHSVRVDLRSGEHWFCSAAEARRAGFRAAGR